MKISVVIASRSRPDLCRQTVTQLIAGMELEDTKIAIALDADDNDFPKYQLIDFQSRVVFSYAEREDSLGAKCNRAQSLVKADLYILWADDMVMPDKGWDAKLASAAKLFDDDGLGVLYFGKIEGVMQPGIAVTDAFVKQMGFYCQPYTPYWFHDTWIDEIGRMCDRILHVDVVVKLLGEMKGQSRGVKDILWWAEFFDRTRRLRRNTAEKIIGEGRDPKWRQIQLRQRIPALEQLLNNRNSVLRDPARAKQLEEFYALKEPEDNARYDRLKEAAAKILQENNL